MLCSKYWNLLFLKDNFLKYLSSILLFLNNSLRFLIIILPVFLIFIIIKNNKKIINNDYNKDSNLLIKFKKLENIVLIPIKNWILNFYYFLKNNSYYLKIWLFLFLYSFNIIAIFIAFI